jgi:hypothetical protein
MITKSARRRALLNAGALTLAGCLAAGTAPATAAGTAAGTAATPAPDPAGAGEIRSLRNAEVSAEAAATVTVAVRGRETYQQVSVLGAPPRFEYDHDRLTSVTITAKAGEPHLGLWVGVRHPRAHAGERLRGSLVLDRAGGENVTASVTGHWHEDTRTFEGTWHGKQVTRPDGRKKTLVLSGTLSLVLPPADPGASS